MRFSPARPMDCHHSMRKSRQNLYQSCDSEGWQKNSSSAWSNSRERNVKLRGVTSLRKLVPILTITEGIVTRVESTMFLNCKVLQCAVSGGRYALSSSPAVAPM